MEFSDESDAETNCQAESKETEAPKKRTTTRRVAQSCKTSSDPPAEKAQPKRQTKGKKGTAVAQANSPEGHQPTSTRRGRTRRELSRAEADSIEELEKMRTIDEKTTEVLDLSIEQLRTSDTEDNSASSKIIGKCFCFLFVMKWKRVPGK